MAITRCPYCRAIIDEKDPYCSNCGTQLLFPEDEAAEEEIPGEKIIDADVEDKDYEIPEPGAASASTEDDAEAEDFDDGGEDTTPIVLGEAAGDEEAADEGGEAEDAVIVVDDAAVPPAAQPDEPAPPLHQRGRPGRPSRGRPAAEASISGTAAGAEGGNGASEKSRPVRKRGRPSKPPRRASVIVVDEAAVAEPAAEAPAEPMTPAEPPPAKPKLIFGSTPMPVLGTEPGPLPSGTGLAAAAGKSPDQVQDYETPPVEAAPASASAVSPPPAAPAAPETAEDEKAMARPAAPQGRPGRDLTFDTRELDRVGPTVDAGQDEIERFFKVLEDKEKESERRPPGSVDLSDILPPWARGVKKDEPAEPRRDAAPDSEAAAVPDSDALGRPEDDRGTAADLEAVPPLRSDETGEDLDTGGEETLPPRPRLRWPSKVDSGVGLPEKITQRDLPFDAALDESEDERRAEAEEDEEEFDFPVEDDREVVLRRPARLPDLAREDAGEEEEEEEAEEAEEARSVVIRLSSFLKGRLFDAVFVLVFWLTGVILATRLLRASLPGLLRSAGVPLAIFYAVLLVFYLFLFRFFLGETLGDRVFRDRPESAPRPRE